MTVRHVESMIRMAEANAKLHLRDFVRQDDLDLAIQMMLDSFLSANKSSVFKTLKKKFQKYMVSAQDNEELLHHLLKTLANEHYKYALFNNPELRRQESRRRAGLEATDDDPTSIKVEFDADEFEVRAREVNIMDVSAFYKSRLFVNNGYRLETRTDNLGRESKYIVKMV
jgi:DNA replication licensing factor MCM2